MSSVGVEPAIELALITEQLVQVAILFGGLSAGGNFHGPEADVAAELQAFLESELHDKVGVDAEFHLNVPRPML